MNKAHPVIYVIACGSPAASGVYDFVNQLHASDWKVCVIATPMGAKFLECERLEAATGYPVRATYKDPEAPDILPAADAFVVAPATFNTINKLAYGISDTLASGLLCEGVGYGHPVIIAPWMNRALARHGAYRRSLQILREEGVRFVLSDRTQPGPSLVDSPEKFPWERLLWEISQIQLSCASRE
jgi:phosphopantothenoylcysteine synthetase/decarboxylase